MTTNEALDTVIGIAALWGENIEEAFRFRLDAEDSDERVKEAVDYNKDGDPVPSDLEDATRVRDLWKAMKVLKA